MNPHGISPLDPKSSASTGSATLALRAVRITLRRGSPSTPVHDTAAGFPPAARGYGNGGCGILWSSRRPSLPSPSSRLNIYYKIRDAGRPRAIPRGGRVGLHPFPQLISRRCPSVHVQLKETRHPRRTSGGNRNGITTGPVQHQPSISRSMSRSRRREAKRRLSKTRSMRS